MYNIYIVNIFVKNNEFTHIYTHTERENKNISKRIDHIYYNFKKQVGVFSIRPVSSKNIIDFNVLWEVKRNRLYCLEINMKCTEVQQSSLS